MVFGRKGTGGPQLAEVNRMLATESESVAAERAWLAARSEHFARAEADLERAFVKLSDTHD
jgi:argininosuccinate lyase